MEIFEFFFENFLIKIFNPKSDEELQDTHRLQIGYTQEKI